MLLSTLFWNALTTLIVAVGVSSSPVGDENTPLLEITASFPEDNPFGQVVNGERNSINLLIENKSGQNVTLMTAGGSFHQPDTEALVKNTSTLSYGIFMMDGTRTQIPYTFHSELKAGDIKLRIWLNYLAETTVYQTVAYDSIVTIVEPEISIFHYQVWSTYAIVLTILGGLGYFAYNTFFPSTKKTRKAGAPPPKAAISSPVGKVTAAGAGGYEEEWIPEHHLKKTRTGKRREGAASSGDESVIEADDKKKKRK